MIYQGFKQTFSNFDPATNTYAPHRDARTTLKRLTVDSYELQLPDGSRRRYVQPDGTTQAGRRVYLTEVSDPQGNTVTVTYGASNRITRITDATAQRWFDLSYEHVPDYYRITKVTDNLGRRALFAHNANGRLTGITDAVDLTSSFLYQANAAGAPTNFIKSMTTPYGTTRFATYRWTQPPAG